MPKKKRNAMCDEKCTKTPNPAPLIRRIAVLPIKLYRYTLSAFLGRRCRFEPTCSVYTIEAIERHGVWFGFWLGLSRIWRCSPWGDSGYDPVPEKLKNNGIRGWKNARWGVKHKK